MAAVIRTLGFFFVTLKVLVLTLPLLLKVAQCTGWGVGGRKQAPSKLQRADHCCKLFGYGNRLWNQSWMQISGPGCSQGKPGSFSQRQVPLLQRGDHNAMHIAVQRMEKYLRCFAWSQGWTNVTLLLGLWLLAETSLFALERIP